MADTKQSRAVAAANFLMGTIMAQAEALFNNCQKFTAEYNAEQYASTWNALPTCAQNADGSLGAQDASPVTTHPINTQTVLALTKAVSATQLTGGVTFCNQFVNMMTNAAVVQGNYIQTVADLND